MDKLSKNIGFHDWKIRELLELTDEEDTIREIILMRDFYTKNEEIKDPAGNERLESKIENARRKNAVSMFINDGQEIWQIADFFGVTRDEIREYITNAGVNLEAFQSEDSESHRLSSDASVSSSETKKKKADQNSLFERNL